MLLLLTHKAGKIEKYTRMAYIQKKYFEINQAFYVGLDMVKDVHHCTIAVKEHFLLVL